MTPITFRVFGTPKGQPRPRAFAFHGKARVYDPGTAEGWKSQVADAAREVLPQEPFLGPLSLRLVFYVPRPKKHYKRDKVRDDAPGFCVGKPDADNLAKAVMDAMTTLGFWVDDSQVAILDVRKHYADNKPGVSVFLSSLRGEEVISVTRGEE